MAPATDRTSSASSDQADEVGDATALREIIEAAMELACRAPSSHNSRPWRWVIDGRRIHLYRDTDRMLPFLDSRGRQTIISCGVALHHARVALATLGWTTRVDRIPDTANPYHLATLEVTGRGAPTKRDVALAVAIAHRRTDRQPYGKLPDSAYVESQLQGAAAAFAVILEKIALSDRTPSGPTAERAAATRLFDSMRHAELRWRTGKEPIPESASPEALPSERRFPWTPRGARHFEVREDRATILVLATLRDAPPEWLRCGEALSAVLLSCTALGLASCPLTHPTEVSDSRALIAGLLNTVGTRRLAYATERIKRTPLLPQVLVRVGVAARAPATNRPECQR